MLTKPLDTSGCQSNKGETAGRAAIVTSCSCFTKVDLKNVQKSTTF